MEGSQLLVIPCAIYLCGLALSKRRKVRLPHPLMKAWAVDSIVAQLSKEKHPPVVDIPVGAG